MGGAATGLVLDVRDQSGVERMRRETLALERRVVLAFGADLTPVQEGADPAVRRPTPEESP